MNNSIGCFEPDWPCPKNVRSLITLRTGGASQGAFASFNLGTHVGDAPEHVAANRTRLRALLPCEPRWLEQVHGTHVLDLDASGAGAAKSSSPSASGIGARADAALTRQPGVVAAIMSADCLPLLLCAQDGSAVAAAHAGWRGLCDGVIEASVRALRIAPESVLAYLAPAISQAAYEVGAEVRAAFLARDANAAAAFASNARGRWQADLYALARQRLHALGVTRVFGGDFCTFRERERYFSFRRDGATGRMASLIWMSA